MNLFSKIAFIVLLCFLTDMVRAQQGSRFLKLETKQGSCIFKLYDQTPIHRDNFIDLVKQGYFDKTTFNRIIKGFVIQGGDPDSLYEKSNARNAFQKWIPAEFHDSLFHKRGVIAMGRDDNSEKASFATQFYIVDGRRWTDSALDKIEKKYFPGRGIPFWKKEVYKLQGGTPHLDHNYTVIGEIIQGLELINALTIVEKTGETPVSPIHMKIKLLSRKKARKLGLH